MGHVPLGYSGATLDISTSRGAYAGCRVRDLHFSIEQVRDPLALADRRDQSCATVDELTRAHLAEVERKIADLEGRRRGTGNPLSRCWQGTISTCLIIEALGPAQAE
ncbi:MerR family DNA-binding protein [Brevundimonas naejangsanensis]|uniref:MerR family DNA-binding protein n=1 Tax=Brevundimonas naejangsanensis TaxID=588932 RepID=UPI0032087394